MNTHINSCPITGKINKTKYFDLGNIPLVNNLFDSQEEALNCKTYPLSVNYFHSSGLSALSYAIDGELLFSNYVFKSGVNTPYIKHCSGMFDYINQFSPFENGDIIVDIGGNDGTLLKSFREKNGGDDEKLLSFINIDPSKNLTEISKNENGIDVINDFFTDKLVSSIEWKADVITSTNVFQHLKDINGFVKGISNFLNKDGIWVLEFPYWIHSMETNQFDQVYHEHMYYYSVTPLNILFKKHGLQISDISFQKMHGGSLRLIISRIGDKFDKALNLKEYLNKEKKFDFTYCYKWGKELDSFICKSIYELNEIYCEQQKTIWGFGAAAKGCIFLNALGFDYRDIPYIIDDTDLKQGKFVPGIGSKIISREILKTQQPDYILILAHNFKDYIIDSLRDYGFKGKFITLIPEFKIHD